MFLVETRRRILSLNNIFLNYIFSSIYFFGVVVIVADEVVDDVVVVGAKKYI